MMVTIDPSFHDEKHYAMAQLAQIRDDLEDSMRAELLAIMEKVKNLAISLCPSETGSLRSSISLEEGSLQAGDFANYNIYAGNEAIINPISGKPTSTYALFVHDGHAMPDGSFWEGIPFLTEALQAYESELENAIDRAMREISSHEPSGSDIAAMEHE